MKIPGHFLASLLITPQRPPAFINNYTNNLQTFIICGGANATFLIMIPSERNVSPQKWAKTGYSIGREIREDDVSSAYSIVNKYITC